MTAVSTMRHTSESIERTASQVGLLLALVSPPHRSKAQPPRSSLSPPASPRAPPSSLSHPAWPAFLLLAPLPATGKARVAAVLRPIWETLLSSMEFMASATATISVSHARSRQLGNFDSFLVHRTTSLQPRRARTHRRSTIFSWL
jgi:hypothetical protein